MIIAYLDEFGHLGPYFSRDHAKHNTSPVFGLAGILLPENSIRQFSSFFIQQKIHLLGSDIQKSQKQAYEWEKKGSSLFTSKSLEKYPEIKATAFRMLNKIDFFQGKLFFYGREKFKCREDGDPNGLYRTVLSESLRRLDSYCEEIDQRFFVVMDQHSARKELLETASKTMFGNQPLRNMVSPPFEGESHYNQNIQAADWIATLVGRVANYRFDSAGFQNYSEYEKFFLERLARIAVNSTVSVRTENKMVKPRNETIGNFGKALAEAYERKRT